MIYDTYIYICIYIYVYVYIYIEKYYLHMYTGIAEFVPLKTPSSLRLQARNPDKGRFGRCSVAKHNTVRLLREKQRSWRSWVTVKQKMGLSRFTCWSEEAPKEMRG